MVGGWKGSGFRELSPLGGGGAPCGVGCVTTAVRVGSSGGGGGCLCDGVSCDGGEETETLGTLTCADGATCGSGVKEGGISVIGGGGSLWSAGTP